MAKYIILSFDDGRKDTYTKAVPVMLEYGIQATINITTNFVENPNSCGLFPTVTDRAMTIANVLELHEKGFEIANHGDMHKNTIEDIKIANTKLKNWGIPIKKIGFASPYSYLNIYNCNDIESLVKTGEISYIRSGTQMRREKLKYKIIYILERLFRFPILFYWLNRVNIIDIFNIPKILKGISVNHSTTVKEILYLIKKMPNNTCIILNFHSVLEMEEFDYYDKWSWDLRKFKKLCKALVDDKNITVIKNIDLLKNRRKNEKSKCNHSFI